MSIEYYEDKEMNVYKLETSLEKLMGKEINEMWEELLPKIEERDKYKERIDKAIEYIEENKYDFCDEYELRDEDGKKIIDILKDDRK